MVGTSRIAGRGRYWTSTGVVALTALLLLVASPAAASHKALEGHGTAPTGTESINTDPDEPAPVPPFCLEVEDSTYTFEITEGRFEGAHNDVVFTVDANTTDKPVVTLQTTEVYYIAPEGTYGARDPVTGACDPTTFADLDPVTIEATVTTAGTGAGIDCDVEDGEYFRINTELFFEWTGDCTIVDDDGTTTGVTPDETEHSFTARIIPPNQPQDGEWNYEYTP